jgi:ornithine carbamoyltransferase
MRNFIDIDALPADALRSILNEAHRRKQARTGSPRGSRDADSPLSGHTLAMLFQKNSTRTRFSFEMAMRQLGGTSIVLAAEQSQISRGETFADTAKVLSRLVDAIMLRANSHGDLLELAEHATVPVINGLTDKSHPCQILADLMTYEERRGSLAGARFAWLGDGNNVATSFIHAAPKFGFHVTLACPGGFRPDPALIAAAGGHATVVDDPAAAASDADAVVTDTWVSMGDTNKQERYQALGPFQVNSQLMRKARADAIFLHCLPAHRGEEVTAEVIDGPQSAIWDEAENRLHVQKAVLLWCLER